MRTVEQEFAVAQELAVQVRGLQFMQVVDMEGNRIRVICNGRNVTVETWQEAVIAARIMMANFS